MISIAILLMVLGFGSAFLNLAGIDITFRIIAWLDDFQPWAGLVIGLVGAALLALAISNRRKETAHAAPNDLGTAPR